MEEGVVVLVQCRSDIFDACGRVDTSHQFPVYFFGRNQSQHPCVGKVHALQVDIRFFQFGSMLHIVGELVELVPDGEITGEESVIDGMLRRVEPEPYELVVVYRVNDLPCSIFLLVSEPCMLIGVLTEDILRIEQRKQLQKHIDGELLISCFVSVFMCQSVDNIFYLPVIGQLAERLLQPAVSEACIHLIDNRFERVERLDGGFLVFQFFFVKFIVFVLFYFVGCSGRGQHELHHQQFVVTADFLLIEIQPEFRKSEFAQSVVVLVPVQ